MRVYEYAKNCGITSKELIRILDENGVYNKTPQSLITEEEIKQSLIAIQQEDIPIEIDPIEINSKDFYDVNTELVQVYPQALYYFGISPRGVGKSTNGILLALKTYIDEGNPSVLMRRRDVELNAGKLVEVFGEIIALGYINYWTKGKYNSVHTIGMRSYLCKRDEDGKIVEKDKQFFLYAIPLAESGNIKGIQLNKAEENMFIKYIIFDELIPVDNSYLPNEANLFFQTISSIIRHYSVAKIICLGNTIVGSLNPILNEFGIDIYSFKLGEKRLYKYDAENEEDINYAAVHFIDKKQYKGIANKNNKYFNTGNGMIASVTGENDGEYGVWELNKDFNSKPREYKKKDIIFKFYWIYSDEIYQADVIQLEDCRFIYNHNTKRKFKGSKEDWLDCDNELIFSTIYDPRHNWINSISGCKLKRVAKIMEIIKSGKVYFQNAWISMYFQNVMEGL